MKKGFGLYRQLRYCCDNFCRASWLWAYRLFASIHGKTIVHFLHIGKTGGTSIKNALKCRNRPYVSGNYVIFCHSHKKRLRDTLPGEKVFFFVRNPLTRFVSGFYSRNRKGLPRIYNEWSRGERQAFETFATPDELASALTADRRALRQRAIDAMRNIRHVNTTYWDWFGSREYFQQRIHDVLFAGRQESLRKDFYRLKRVLELPEHVRLPEDEIRTHKNPSGLDKKLSPRGLSSLTEWYCDDFAFIRMLEDLGVLE